MAFKSVCVIGASGNIGSLVVKHLLASGQNFKVTVVSRQSSTAEFADGVAVTRVPDDYPVAELTNALKGIDVVVAALSMTSMGEQYKIIDACVAAGVKRYFPTEFGLDDLPDWLLQLREMFKIKHDVRDRLIDLAKEKPDGLEWTSICCNAFFEMGVASGFFQLHWADKKAILLDGGEARFVATTLDTVALAVVKAIESPDLSKNRILLIQDFQISQLQVLDAVREKVPKWDVEVVPSGPWLEDGIQAVKGGDNSQLSKLTFGTFATGNRYEGREEYGNEVLKLPVKTFNEAMDMFWAEYPDLLKTE